MDDNKIMEAAKLIANSSAALIEAIKIGTYGAIRYGKIFYKVIRI